MYLFTHRNNGFVITLVFYSNIIITVNRSGGEKTYVVPTEDSSYGGTYTCLVTVSYVTSEESNGVKITATGIPILFYCVLCVS